MGLAEKRIAEGIKTTKLPKFESDLQGFAGFPMEVTFDWASLTAFDSYPLSRLENYVLRDVSEAIEKICKDDLGKEALKESIAKIHIVNTDQAEAFGIELKDSVLTLTERLAGGTFSYHDTNMIVDYIESVL